MCGIFMFILIGFCIWLFKWVLFVGVLNVEILIEVFERIKCYEIVFFFFIMWYYF